MSTYIAPLGDGKITFQVERGLDVAIGEYAPGRSVVVDKQTYQIGGFYSPGKDFRTDPAKSFFNDPEYNKELVTCPRCEWFGLKTDDVKACPFCGNKQLDTMPPMLRPWGFAPRDGKKISEAQLNEEYSSVQQPLYSTLPDADEMKVVRGCSHIRCATRSNQRIIMLNRGKHNSGFMVCADCGASMPGDSLQVLSKINRPYKYTGKISAKCSHTSAEHVNLGYDFITDMLVMEFALDEKKLMTDRGCSQWINRAAQSLAEAFRLTASKELDVELTELVAGARYRTGEKGVFVDVYLYDSLSSGAGYAIALADRVEDLLEKTRAMLSACDCDDACYNCLKHYRNQQIHGMLDRRAAQALLQWGISGKLPDGYTAEQQLNLVEPITKVLESYGFKIQKSEKCLSVLYEAQRKKLVIYPAMLRIPQNAHEIQISDLDLKLLRASAVKKIKNALR